MKKNNVKVFKNESLGDLEVFKKGDGSIWFEIDSLCDLVDIDTPYELLDEYACEDLYYYNKTIGAAYVNEVAALILIKYGDKNYKEVRQWIFTDVIPEAEKDYDENEEVLITFKFTSRLGVVRAVEDYDDERLFYIDDICKILGYEDVNEVIETYPIDWFIHEELETIVITEEDVYTLILNSNSKNADEFERWFTKSMID